MTDADFEVFAEAMEEQAAALRRSLAADLGGEPGDYRPRPTVDGADSEGAEGATE